MYEQIDIFDELEEFLQEVDKYEETTKETCETTVRSDQTQ